MSSINASFTVGSGGEPSVLNGGASSGNAAGAAAACEHEGPAISSSSGSEQGKVADGIQSEFKSFWAGKWVVGDCDQNREEITSVCGQSPFFAVYFVKGGWLKWYYDTEHIKGAHKLEAEAQILLNKGRQWILEKGEFANYRTLVAAGLVEGLSGLEDGKKLEELRSAFQAAERYLRSKAKSDFKIVFVLAAICASVCISGALLIAATLDTSPLGATQKFFLLGGAFGGYGTLLSILTRSGNSESQVIAFETRGHVILEAIIRVGLGISFGFILVLLQKAKIVLSIAADDQWLTILGAIIAGFNERLIPTLLKQVEGIYLTNEKRNEAQTQTSASNTTPT